MGFKFHVSSLQERTEKQKLGLFRYHFCWLNFVLLFSEHLCAAHLYSTSLGLLEGVLRLILEAPSAGGGLCWRSLLFSSLLLSSSDGCPPSSAEPLHVPVDSGHRCSCCYGNASTAATAPLPPLLCWRDSTSSSITTTSTRTIMIISNIFKRYSAHSMLFSFT